LEYICFIISSDIRPPPELPEVEEVELSELLAYASGEPADAANAAIVKEARGRSNG